MHSNYWHDITLAYQRISQGARLVETACGPIQYTEFGEGPAMLMVHGAGGGFDQGDYFARMIGGTFRWIAPSRFGFLGTPLPPGASSWLQAEAYGSLLDALGIDRVGVVGISMGGPSSLLFAQRYPQRTTSLVLISAASHAISPRPAFLAALFNMFLNDFVFWSLVRLRPEMLLVALGVPAEVQKQLSPDEIRGLHAFLESIIPMGARRKGQNLEQHMSEYDANQIKHIHAPTLVIHARDDTLVGIDHAELTTRSIQGSQFNIIEKGGHLALMLNCNLWAKQNVMEFLKQYNSH